MRKLLIRLSSLFFFFFFLPVSVEARVESCQPGVYYFPQSENELKVQTSASSQSPFFIEAQKEDFLTFTFRTPHYRVLRVGQWRLFYPDGRLYQGGGFKPLSKEGKEYRYQAKVKLKKKLSYLLLEVEIRPWSRRSRAGKIFFFRTLIISSQERSIFPDLSRLCFHPQAQFLLSWQDKKKASKVRVDLIDEFRRNFPISHFVYQFDKVKKESTLSFQLAAETKTDWYSLLISLFYPTTRKVLVLPVFIDNRKEELEIQQPRAAEEINGSELEVRGKLSSYLTGHLQAWYQRAEDSWVPLEFNFSRENEDYQGKFFKWNLSGLENGIYKLRLQWEDLAGLQIEKEVKDLVRDLPQGFLGLKTVPQLHFPSFVVSTFDTRVSNWLAGSKEGKGLLITDTRPSCPGWSVTARFSDLYSPQADHFIPVADHLRLKPTRPKPLERYEEEGVQPGDEAIVPSAGKEVLISKADPGHGCGVYTQNIFLELQVPANTPAGDYQGKIVFTIQ